jgi:hypothetical protein
MSFICHEDGNKLLTVDQAFCVTTETAENYSAVCQAHVDMIPEEDRLKERVERGLDVHFLFARASGFGRPGVDTIAMTGAEFGEYRFSVREELARLVLPRCCELYLPE